MSNFINWSEISRSICGDRKRIEKTYSGKKYKEVVKDLHKLNNLIKARIDQFTKQNYKTK